MPVVAVLWDAVPRICLSCALDQDTYISNRQNAIACASNARGVNPYFVANIGENIGQRTPNCVLPTSILYHHAKIAGQKRGWLDEDQPDLFTSSQFGNQTENRTEPIEDRESSSTEVSQWSWGIFTRRHTFSSIIGSDPRKIRMPWSSQILNPTRIDEKVTDFGRASLQTFSKCGFLAQNRIFELFWSEDPEIAQPRIPEKSVIHILRFFFDDWNDRFLISDVIFFHQNVVVDASHTCVWDTWKDNV